MKQPDSHNPIPLDLLDAFSNAPPPLDFAMPGFLARTLGSVAAPGGTGKSMFKLETAIQVATGLDMLGFGSIPTGPAVYLALEDPEIVLRHRLHAIGAHLPEHARAMVKERLRIYTAEQIGPINLLRSRDVERLIRIAEGARLVGIDTLRRVHSADENDSGAMTEVINALESVCRTTGATISFAHHFSKTGAWNGGELQQSARGSSVITDHVRWQTNLIGMSSTEAKEFQIKEEHRRYYIRVVVAKQNYGQPVPDRWLRREAGGVLRPVTFVPRGQPTKAKAYAVASGANDDWE